MNNNQPSKEKIEHNKSALIQAIRKKQRHLEND